MYELAYEGVSVRLGGRTVADGVSLSVPEGSLTALVGPNGAGKTTLLRVAARLTPFAAGRVTVDGKDVRHWSRRELARVMAMVPQSPMLPPLFAVRAIVALGRSPYLRLLSTESRRDVAIIERSMTDAGVLEFADRRAGSLSGGEQQRVALARALAQEPRVLLLDEPTSNLDLRYQAATLRLVRHLADETGLAGLLVMHDLTLAAQFCDQVALIDHGRLEICGKPAAVLQAARLSGAYQTPLATLDHPEHGTPVVVHTSGEARS